MRRSRRSGDEVLEPRIAGRDVEVIRVAAQVRRDEAERRQRIRVEAAQWNVARQATRPHSREGLRVVAVVVLVVPVVVLVLVVVVVVLVDEFGGSSLLAPQGGE
jgi:hypothetical protein